MGCNDCGLVFTSPRYTANRIASLYSSEYYQKTPDYYRSQMSEPGVDDLNLARTAHAKIGTKKLTGRRSLDVGCGAGRLVEAFKLAGFAAAGIEPNAMAVRAERERGRDIIIGDLTDVAPGSYDCITVMHVLEHVYSPAIFLKCCQIALESGGLLIIEVPNFGSFASRKLKEHWLPLYPDTHLYQFTQSTLSTYLAKSGFKVIQVQKIGGRGFMQSQVAGTVSPNDSMNARKIGATLKNCIYMSRHLVYRLPYAQLVARFILWEVLGQGEFIRIHARRI